MGFFLVLCRGGAVFFRVELVRFLHGSLGRFFGAFLLGAAAAFVFIEAFI